MINYKEEITKKLKEINKLIAFYIDKKNELDADQNQILRGQTEKQIDECLHSLEESRNRLLLLQMEMLK